MMRRLLLLGLVLAGCDDAVVLEVYPAPGVPTERVQLFIGLGVCEDCPGIQPPGATAILPGAVLFREDSVERTVVREAKVEGGVARFRIEPSASFDRFDLAVAVDANGQSAAVIQNLPLDTAGRYRVDLLRAGSTLGAKPAAANGNFVQIWKQPNGALPCMGFERWHDGRLAGERVFIVPESDLDCDARVNECAPYGFDAVGVPTLAEATCTALQASVMDTEICTIGGPACDEVSGGDRACAPTDYCLPSHYCDTLNTACAGFQSPADLARCLFAGEAPLTATLKCTIAFEPSSDGTHADLCTGAATFELFSSVMPSPVVCAGPASELLLQKPTTGPLAFVDDLTFTTKEAGGAVRALDFRLRHDAGCGYKLDLDGEKTLAALAPDRNPAFAQFWVSRNGGPIRKLLAPLRLDFVSGCALETSCKLVLDPNDALAKCLR